MTEITEATEIENTEAIDNLERLAAAAEFEEQAEAQPEEAMQGEVIAAAEHEEALNDSAIFISNILLTTICSSTGLRVTNRISQSCDAAGAAYARVIDKYAPNGIGWLASPEFAAIVCTFNLMAVVKIERGAQFVEEETETAAPPSSDNKGV